MKKFFFLLFVISSVYGFAGNVADYLYDQIIIQELLNVYRMQQQLDNQQRQHVALQRAITLENRQNKKQREYKISLKQNAHLKNNQLRNSCRNKEK